MKWQDISEVVAGFVLKGKLPADLVDPTILFPPYGEIVKLKRDDKDIPDMVMSDTIGFSAISAVTHALETVNGEASPLEWLTMLETSASRAKSGVDLEKIAKDLKEGKEVDIGDIMLAAGRIETGYRELTPLSEVKPQKNKFIPTGFQPIDQHIGGLPQSCVTIIGGTPGIGKTTLGLKVMSNMVRVHKKKKAALFSLEMTMGQIAQRYVELDKNMTKDEKSRILMDDIPYNIHQIYTVASKAAAAKDLCVIGIDFADLIVEGEQSEATMSLVYRNLSMLAKKTGVPVLLIAQLNRDTYKGGLPHIHNLRYSGLAEATARLILLAYNPDVVMINSNKAEDAPLPSVPGRAYILVGKSNFGYKEGFPGAIVVDWDGEKGWGSKSYGYVRVAS